MVTYAYEDFFEGRRIDLGPYAVTREEIVDFASRFDPQPFHLDEEAAAGTMLGGLAASGWHNCATMMRMMADGYILDSTSQGSPGVEFMRWKRPVRPGDVLSGQAIVRAARLSSSRPGLGIVTIGTDLTNQTGETVLETQYTLLALTRAAAKAEGRNDGGTRP